jgi:soluble lytic murein transglycosylase-like protein
MTMPAPPSGSRFASRPVAAGALVLLLGVAAPCARAPEGAGGALAGAATESRDPELAAVRRWLEPVARELGAREGDALAATLVRTSREHSLPPAFVIAVIEVESRFDPYAVSPKGALGLMQVLPSTGAEVARRIGIPWRGPRTLFDPHANVRIGVAYLRGLVERYASVRAALAAYNWGPGQIDARLRGGSGLPVHYSERVLDAYFAARRAES